MVGGSSQPSHQGVPRLPLIVSCVGERVLIPGFGAFEKRERSARKGRNPRTGEEIDLEASATPSFTASKVFKDAVKQGQ